MIQFGIAVEKDLDAGQFSETEATYAVAVVIAAHAKKSRLQYQLTERKIVRGLLDIEAGYWSDSVPWYEWITGIDVLKPCAKECGLVTWQLADTIAFNIRPPNWEVFSWMGMALRIQEQESSLKASLVRHSITLTEMRKKKRLDAKHAADALHNQPGGSRSKQAEIRKIWQSGKFSNRDLCAEQECANLGMSFSTARKALRNITKKT